MALRDQPYLPLYVQDVLTDEKLIECSASSTGIYFRLICIMHKSDPYGTILLKQKDQQTDQQIKNFAAKLLKHLPYTLNEIESGLNELITEGVIQLNGNVLSQKRMVQDNELSIKRADAGKKGGFATHFAKAKQSANDVANTEYENESEYESDIKNNNKNCLMKNSGITIDQVKTDFLKREDLRDADPVHYFNTVLDWSDSKGRMQKDWLAQIRNFVRRDIREGKIKTSKTSGVHAPPNVII